MKHLCLYCFLYQESCVITMADIYLWIINICIRNKLQKKADTGASLQLCCITSPFANTENMTKGGNLLLFQFESESLFYFCLTWDFSCSTFQGLLCHFCSIMCQMFPGEVGEAGRSVKCPNSSTTNSCWSNGYTVEV